MPIMLADQKPSERAPLSGVRAHLALLATAVAIAGCATTAEESVASPPPSSSAPSWSSSRFLDATIGDAGDDCADGRDYRCEEILYGTNRNLSLERIAFGNAIEYDQIALGSIVITIPIRRAPGDPPKTNARSIMPGDATPADRSQFFSVYGITVLSAEAFAARERQLLGCAELEAACDGQVLVFVNGYNTGFYSAAFRAAQLKVDFEFPGPVYFFSWPSDGVLERYPEDAEDAAWSVEALADFLALIQRDVGRDVRLNVIAHSMGAQVLAPTIDLLVERASSGDWITLGTVIFASSDINWRHFERNLVGANHIAERIVVLSSREDRALEARDREGLWSMLSGRGDAEIEIDPHSRLGLLTTEFGPVVADGFTSIDTTSAGMSYLGFLPTLQLRHDDYASSPEILTDLRSLLSGEGDFPATDSAARFQPCPNSARSEGYWTYDRGFFAAACRVAEPN